MVNEYALIKRNLGRAIYVEIRRCLQSEVVDKCASFENYWLIAGYYSYALSIHGVAINECIVLEEIDTLESTLLRHLKDLAYRSLNAGTIVDKLRINDREERIGNNCEDCIFLGIVALEFAIGNRNI